MSIDRSELESTKRPLRERILQFLQSDSTKAFNLYEIAAHIKGISHEAVTLSSALLAIGTKKDGLEEYRAELEQLVQQGTIVAGYHKGQMHYAIGDEK